LTSYGALLQGLKATAMTLWLRLECQVFSYPIANNTLQTTTPLAYFTLRGLNH